MGENIYNIAGDFLTLSAMEPESEEDWKAFDALVDEVQGRFEDKAEKILGFRTNLLKDAAGWKAEGQRILDAGRMMEKKADRLLKYLEGGLVAIGATTKDRYTAGTWTMRLQENPPSLKIDALEKVPEEFLEPQPPKVKTAEVKQAIAEGSKVPGVHIERTISIRVK
jgi:hypothetical protein